MPVRLELLAGTARHDRAAFQIAFGTLVWSIDGDFERMEMLNIVRLYG